MSGHVIGELSGWFQSTISPVDWPRAWTSGSASFVLVAVAEFGDKSQLVCMTLASRHRHGPVFWGSLVAFALLNAIGVTFGAAVARWLPETAVTLMVAALFGFFGLRHLLDSAEEGVGAVVEKSGHSLFITTFSMIFLAEFGDKTQLAVAGLAAAEPPLAVWSGATLALGAMALLGIWAGRLLLRRINPRLMSRVTGLLFLLFALAAGFSALPTEFWSDRLRELALW